MCPRCRKRWEHLLLPRTRRESTRYISLCRPHSPAAAFSTAARSSWSTSDQPTSWRDGTPRYVDVDERRNERKGKRLRLLARLLFLSCRADSRANGFPCAARFSVRGNRAKRKTRNSERRLHERAFSSNEPSRFPSTIAGDNSFPRLYSIPPNSIPLASERSFAQT